MGVYCVLSGSVDVLNADLSDLLQSAGEGTVVGAFEVLAGAPRCTVIRAATPTFVAKLGQVAYSQLAAKFPDMPTVKAFRAFDNVALLKQLRPAPRCWLFVSAEVERFQHKSSIFQEGAVATKFGVVVSGEVKLLRRVDSRVLRRGGAHARAHRGWASANVGASGSVKEVALLGPSQLVALECCFTSPTASSVAVPYTHTAIAAGGVTMLMLPRRHVYACLTRKSLQLMCEGAASIRAWRHDRDVNAQADDTSDEEDTEPAASGDGDDNRPPSPLRVGATAVAASVLPSQSRAALLAAARQRRAAARPRSRSPNKAATSPRAFQAEPTASPAVGSRGRGGNAQLSKAQQRNGSPTHHRGATLPVTDVFGNAAAVSLATHHEASAARPHRSRSPTHRRRHSPTRSGPYGGRDNITAAQAPDPEDDAAWNEVRSLLRPSTAPQHAVQFRHTPRAPSHTVAGHHHSRARPGRSTRTWRPNNAGTTPRSPARPQTSSHAPRPVNPGSRAKVDAARQPEAAFEAVVGPSGFASGGHGRGDAVVQWKRRGAGRPASRVVVSNLWSPAASRRSPRPATSNGARSVAPAVHDKGLEEGALRRLKQLRALRTGEPPQRQHRVRGGGGGRGRYRQGVGVLKQRWRTPAAARSRFMGFVPTSETAIPHN